MKDAKKRELRPLATTIAPSHNSCQRLILPLQRGKVWERGKETRIDAKEGESNEKIKSTESETVSKRG